jgi:hypothetical protein
MLKAVTTSQILMITSASWLRHGADVLSMLFRLGVTFLLEGHTCHAANKSQR